MDEIKFQQAKSERTMMQQDLNKKITDTARSLDLKFNEYTSEYLHNSLKEDVENILKTMASQD